MQVTVDEHELAVVKRLPQERLETVFHEIQRTDRSEFKHALEREEDTLKGLAVRL